MNRRGFFPFYALLVLVFIFSAPKPTEAKLKGSWAVDVPLEAADVPQILGIRHHRNLKKDKKEEEEEEGCGSRFWCNVNEVFTGIWDVKKDVEDVFGLIIEGIFGIFGFQKVK
jgi:hypothetical protein